MARLMPDPMDKVKLTDLRVVFFQKTESRKTTDKGGAIKPNTAWNTSKRLSPFMLSIAIAIIMANKHPANTVMRPTFIICWLVAAGFIFFCINICSKNGA